MDEQGSHSYQPSVDGWEVVLTWGVLAVPDSQEALQHIDWEVYIPWVWWVQRVLMQKVVYHTVLFPSYAGQDVCRGESRSYFLSTC